jgi:hypothetical protein
LSCRRAPADQTGGASGNVNRSAIASVHERLAPFGLKVLSDIGSVELEQRYSSSTGHPPRRLWGALRIAHAGHASAT